MEILPETSQMLSYYYQFSEPIGAVPPLYWNFSSGDYPYGIVLDPHTGEMSGYMPLVSPQEPDGSGYTHIFQLSVVDSLSSQFFIDCSLFVRPTIGIENFSSITQNYLLIPEFVTSPSIVYAETPLFVAHKIVNTSLFPNLSATATGAPSWATVSLVDIFVTIEGTPGVEDIGQGSFFNILLESDNPVAQPSIIQARIDVLDGGGGNTNCTFSIEGESIPPVCKNKYFSYTIKNPYSLPSGEGGGF